MKTIAFVTQKGGTGKSSLSVSLAVAAQERGLKPYLIDLDPQGTTGNWYERRESEAGPEVAAIDAMRLAPVLGYLRQRGTDLVILDTPGIDTPATTAAMQAADLCLIPARPSVADIEAARPTIQALNKLGKPFAFVINQAPPGFRATRTSDAYRALHLMGAVSGVSLVMRADHVDALAAGLGVTELDPAGKAAREVKELLQWILIRMKGMHDEAQSRVA